MVTPGLLPEASDPRPPTYRVTAVLLILAAGVVMAWVVRVSFRLRAERDLLAAEVGALRHERDLGSRRAQIEHGLQSEIMRLHKELDAAKAGVEAAAAPAVGRAPDIRVAPRELAQERITQGLHEFRSGRFLQAELAFLRAVPEAYGYIVLTCFVRGDVREAVLFLGRALASDPEWLRRVKPRDLFGAPEEYEKALRALEERVSRDPLDPEAKTLLAYFRLHDKGPEYAKALLVEAVNAAPGHAEAKRFLEALGP